MTRSRSGPASARFLLIAVAGLALTSCESSPRDGGGAARPIPQARITGPDQTCIPLTRITSTAVRDARTIDFMSGSREGWRNVLPQECPGLLQEEAFTYATSLSQLCSTDIIYVLQRWGSELRRGAGCGLGTFTPITLP